VYPVLIGQGALAALAETVAGLAPSRVALVTDENVFRLWGEGAAEALSGAGIDARVHVVADREEAKTLAQLQQVLDFLEREHLDRRGVVVALGGGTVGDVAGFAAAVWLRGVRWVGVPTTLLAMVDSSVGGKTGINTEETKNGVGAFWQPAAVVSDLATLSTLPEGEIASAFGEIVKYGVAMDADLAERLRRESVRLQAREAVPLEQVVDRCIELKAEVIAADERESGGRAILNYGHTVGHAIEAASGYRATHGRAISQGMRVAVRLAVAQRLCDPSVMEAQEDLLEAYRLPGPLPAVTADQVLAALPRDKKATGGRIGWVLPRRLGRCQVGVAVPPEAVEREVREVFPTGVAG
jgi:3-dehydroquinate synthase